MVPSGSEAMQPIALTRRGIVRPGGIKVLAAMVLSAVFFIPASAQEASTQLAPAGASRTSDKCAEFRDMVGSVDSGSGPPGPEQVEKRYSRLTDATKAAEACAKSITESFRTLREQGGGKSSWSSIERELDGFIKGQQSFIDSIEGTGGLIEEAARSESVAQERIARAQRSFPEYLEKEKERLARLKEIVSATTEQKDALAREIRSLQADKPRIAFSEGGKQFDMAIDSLNRFNKVLEGFTKKMPKAAAGDGGM